MATSDKTAVSVNGVAVAVGTNKHLSSDNATDDISNGKSTPGGVEALEINCATVVTPSARSQLLEMELVLLGSDACKLFLSQGITTVEALLVESPTKNMATALEKQSHYTYSSATSKVNEWKRDVKQRIKNREERPVGLHPAFEVFKPEVLSFFDAMSIATPDDLLDRYGLGQSYKDWVLTNNKKEMRLPSALTHVGKWRDAVKRQTTSTLDSAESTIAGDIVTATIAGAAQLEPELLLLGCQARDFFVSQGITTVKALLTEHSTRNMATALAKAKFYVYSSAASKVDGWKRDTQQRLDTRKERPVGLHPAFEIFSPQLRSFFAAILIATPDDLMGYDLVSLTLAYLDWRCENEMNAIKFESARIHVSYWRESVSRQRNVALDGKAALPLPAPATRISVSARSATSSRALPQERGAVVVPLTEGRRPMSGKLRRKVAKQTFRVTPAPAEDTSTQELSDDSIYQSRGTVSGGMVTSEDEAEPDDCVGGCEAEPERKRHRSNESAPNGMDGPRAFELQMTWMAHVISTTWTK